MLSYNAQINGAALVASDCICLLGKMWNYFTVYLNIIFQENSIYFTKLIGTLIPSAQANSSQAENWLTASSFHSTPVPKLSAMIAWPFSI